MTRRNRAMGVKILRLPWKKTKKRMSVRYLRRLNGPSPGSRFRPIPDRQIDPDDLACSMPAATQYNGPANASSPSMSSGEEPGIHTEALLVLNQPTPAAAEIQSHSQQEEPSDSAEHEHALQADQCQDVAEPIPAGTKRAGQIEESNGYDNQQGHRADRHWTKRLRPSIPTDPASSPRRLVRSDVGVAALDSSSPCVTSRGSLHHDSARKSSAMEGFAHSGIIYQPCPDRLGGREWG
ncbi:hypothetical protein B0J13DRAFT_608851 [Dactylonectria estremocensis]|uniref:Uncharacterized protein n=1 Tax=Dactylonectria estremocensis TaxID=1079267 RepID=A0A9P9J095_9HYPO|nr:hypothetical protein B0J13DRAFT_608851 [Dactylonectria estremocensis]